MGTKHLSLGTKKIHGYETTGYQGGGGEGVSSVKARLGTWPKPWPVCLWVVWGPAVKSSGEGRVSCSDTLSFLVFVEL